MNKAFTAFFAAVVSYGLLSILAYGVLIKSSSLVGVTVAAYWVIMFLGIGISLLILILSYSVKEGVAGENTQKTIDLVGRVAKKRNPVLRAIDWAERIAIVVLLAYTGWVFTGVCYALASMVVKLFFSMARENVAIPLSSQ